MGKETEDATPGVPAEQEGRGKGKGNNEGKTGKGKGKGKDRSPSRRKRTDEDGSTIKGNARGNGVRINTSWSARKSGLG